VKELSWKVFGLDPVGMTASVAVRGAGPWQALGSGLPPLGSLQWDTQGLADGSYDLRIQFFDAGAQLLAERTRRVLVLNSPGVTWHAGALSGVQTWPTGTVHVLDGAVVIGSGAQVTVQPGAVVKAAADGGLWVANAGVLHALGNPGSPIVFTSLADDTAGGDTNANSGQTQPVSGDWLGISAIGTGLADLNQYAEVRYARAEHAGTLTGNATWSKRLLHIVNGDVTVPNGVTLTLEPGAIVKLGTHLGITVQAGGHLVAEGTIADPIRLTSLADDAVAGDTNRDGSATAPAEGDWRWIYFDGGTGSFNHALLSYGGGTASGNWDQTGVLRTNGNASLTIDNTIIRQPFFDGVLALGGPVTVRNSVVTGADRGICASSGTVKVINSTVDDNRIGLLVHGGSLDVANTIVSHSLEAGILHDYGADALTIRYSDVWNPGAANYSGTADRTGTNGNLAADPKLAAPAAGDCRPSFGSPAVDAADGSVASATDLRGATRYDDPYTANTGTPVTSGAYADMGAYEFVLSTAAKVDLAVTTAHGTPAAQQATVTWTVTNQSGETAVGPWSDAIYLSTSAVLDGSARLLGQAVHEGILEAGASYDASLTQALPRCPTAAIISW
jgi:hypothetical protein